MSTDPAATPSMWPDNHNWGPVYVSNGKRMMACERCGYEEEVGSHWFGTGSIVRPPCVILTQEAPDTPTCECGAAKALKVGPGHLAHARWCPVAP